MLKYLKSKKCINEPDGDEHKQPDMNLKRNKNPVAAALPRVWPDFLVVSSPVYPFTTPRPHLVCAWSRLQGRLWFVDDKQIWLIVELRH